MSENIQEIILNSPFQITNMSGNIINSKQPFVNFYRKGQIITKEMLNDQFIRSVLFDLSKKSRFISGVNYLSYGYHGISILGQDNYTITYNETDQLYELTIFNLNNPIDDNQLFDDDTLIFLESIEELYNITRNEVYYIEDIIHTFNTEQGKFNQVVKFQQPNETESMISDVETSQYRYIFNLSSYLQMDKILNQKIECSFDESEETLFYYMKNNQDKTFDLYSIDLREIGRYIQEYNLDFGEVLTDIQMNNNENDYQFIHYETELDFSLSNVHTYKDLTITFDIFPEYSDLYTVDFVLDNIQNNDILYFYVNRLDGLTIFIDEMLGGRNRVSTKELSDLIQFNNCSYIFRGKLNVYGKLPIVINNMLNISIKGLNKQSSILNFKEQDFNTNSYQISNQNLPDYQSQIEQWKIIDSKNVEFQDMTFEVYDPYLSETYPVSLLSNKYLMFGTITQTTNTERTSDKIFANDIQIRFFNSVFNVDDNPQNIYPQQPQRIDTSKIQFTPRGSELLEDIISQYNQSQPDIDLSLLPFQDLKIGNGTEEVLSYNPEEILHFTSTDNRFLINYDNLTNNINFSFDNVQDQDHVHDAQIIQSGVLQTQVGGLNNNIFSNDSVLVYDGVEDKFLSSKTIQEIEQSQNDNVQIKILNGESGTEFTLNYNSGISFKSMNSGNLEITFDNISKQIRFNQIVPVKSVNSKTGNIILSQYDVGQQQDDHLHDNRYFKKIGGNIIPTSDSENFVTFKNSQSNNIFRIDSINNKIVSDLNNISLESNKININGVSIEVTDTHVIVSQ